MDKHVGRILLFFCFFPFFFFCNDIKFLYNKELAIISNSQGTLIYTTAVDPHIEIILLIN